MLKRSGGHRIPGMNCCGRSRMCYRWSKRSVNNQDFTGCLLSLNSLGHFQCELVICHKYTAAWVKQEMMGKLRDILPVHHLVYAEDAMLYLLAV